MLTFSTRFRHSRSQKPRNWFTLFLLPEALQNCKPTLQSQHRVASVGPAGIKTWRRFERSWPTRQRLGVRRSSAAFDGSALSEFVRFMEYCFSSGRLVSMFCRVASAGKPTISLFPFPTLKSSHSCPFARLTSATIPLASCPFPGEYPGHRSAPFTELHHPAFQDVRVLFKARSSSPVEAA